MVTRGRIGPTRLGGVVEGQDPVVIGLAAARCLAVGSDIACDRGIHHTEREGSVISPLYQEASLVIGIVRPGQGDCGRLTIPHNGAPGQVARVGDGGWWKRHVPI